MKNMTPSDFANKWSNRVAGAGQDYAKGISSVTEAPGAKAAAQKDVYIQNVTTAADKWATNVGNVSLAEWKKQTLDFGVSKYSAGAAKGKRKMQDFGAALIPFLQSAQGSLPARGNSAANQQRYQAMQSAWSTFKYSKRSL